MLETAARMLDEGDLRGRQGAARQGDRARTKKDLAVVSALARLETIRADLYWLKLRLLDPADQAPGAPTPINSSGRRIGKAREAVDRATGGRPPPIRW